MSWPMQTYALFKKQNNTYITIIGWKQLHFSDNIQKPDWWELNSAWPVWFDPPSNDYVHDKFCQLIWSVSSEGLFELIPIISERKLFWCIDYCKLINAKISDNKHLLKAHVVVCLHVNRVVKQKRRRCQANDVAWWEFQYGVHAKHSGLFSNFTILGICKGILDLAINFR